MPDSNFLHDFAGAGSSQPTTQQLYRMFVLLGYDFGYEEAREDALSRLADFANRWGKTWPDNIFAAAHHTESAVDGDSDTLLALAALATLRPSGASSVLFPYLTSSYNEERWLSAFGLAALHDERALPTLGHMLLEFISPNQPWGTDNGPDYIFELWRARLPRILTDWGNLQVVPLLRNALIATVQARESTLQDPVGPEQEFFWSGRRYTGQEAWRKVYDERREWAELVHRFVYALGRLGAFGALIGVPTRPGIYYHWPPPIVYAIDEAGENPVEVDMSRRAGRVPESRADVFEGAIWRVHACFGYLEPQFRDPRQRIHTFTHASELAEAIERLLEGQFGLDAVERRQAMEDYERSKFLQGTLSEYERLSKQAQEDAE